MAAPSQPTVYDIIMAERQADPRESAMDYSKWSVLEQILLLELHIKGVEKNKIAPLVNQIMETWFDPHKNRPKDHRSTDGCSLKRAKMSKGVEYLEDVVAPLIAKHRATANGPQELQHLESAIELEMMTMLDKPPYWSTPDDKIEPRPEDRGFMDWTREEFDELVMWPWQGEWEGDGIQENLEDPVWAKGWEWILAPTGRQIQERGAVEWKNAPGGAKKTPTGSRKKS